MLQAYEWFLWGMAALAVVVFVALYHVKAGYGLLRDGRWGPKIGNRLGWFLMESPVFIAMCLFWFCSSRRFEATPLVFFGLFQLHYLNRAFIYPLLLKGQSKMPLGIIVMGVVFNLLNACMQGCWIFYLAPEGMYSPSGCSHRSLLPVPRCFFSGWVSISIPTGLSDICASLAIRAITCRGAGCSVTCRRPIISGKSSSGPVLPC